jgi:hypothetical protein
MQDSSFPGTKVPDIVPWDGPPSPFPSLLTYFFSEAFALLVDHGESLVFGLLLIRGAAVWIKLVSLATKLIPPLSALLNKKEKQGLTVDSTTHMDFEFNNNRFYPMKLW